MATMAIMIWKYTYPPNKGFHIGSRGVAMYGNWLYYMTPDAHLICLNASDGKVRWNVPVADSAKGYWLSTPKPARPNGNGIPLRPPELPARLPAA